MEAALFPRSLFSQRVVFQAKLLLIAPMNISRAKGISGFGKWSHFAAQWSINAHGPSEGLCQTNTIELRWVRDARVFDVQLHSSQRLDDCLPRQRANPQAACFVWSPYNNHTYNHSLMNYSNKTLQCPDSESDLLIRRSVQVLPDNWKHSRVSWTLFIMYAHFRLAIRKPLVFVVWRASVSYKNIMMLSVFSISVTNHKTTNLSYVFWKI